MSIPDTTSNSDNTWFWSFNWKIDIVFLNVAFIFSDEDSNESFEVGIPQLDGVGDNFEDKKEKSIKKSALNFTTNPKTDYCLKQNVPDGYSEDFKENNNCWPESGKLECLDDVFNDDDVLNSPTHIIEDNSGLQIEPVNIDFISSFETVLRGDPTFSLKDSASSDDVLLETRNNPVSWNNSLELNNSAICDKIAVESVEDSNLKSSMDNVCDIPCQNLNATRSKFSQAISASNYRNKNNFGPSANDKTFCLSFCSEGLSTNQLDEKLDEELNIGIQIIYENSLQGQIRDCAVEINRWVLKIICIFCLRSHKTIKVF